MTSKCISATMIAMYDTYQSHCQVTRILPFGERQGEVPSRSLPHICNLHPSNRGKTPGQPHRATLMPFAFLGVLCRSEIPSHGCMALAPIPCCCRM